MCFATGALIKKIIGGNTRPEGSRDPAFLTPGGSGGVLVSPRQKEARHTRGFKVMRMNPEEETSLGSPTISNSLRLDETPLAGLGTRYRRTERKPRRCRGELQSRHSSARSTYFSTSTTYRRNVFCDLSRWGATSVQAFDL